MHPQLTDVLLALAGFGLAGGLWGVAFHAAGFSLRRHAHHAIHHITALLLVSIVLSGALGWSAHSAYDAYTAHGGATYDPALVIAPRVGQHRGGGGLPDSYMSPDMSVYLPESEQASIQNQTWTLACCSVTDARLLEIALGKLHEQVPVVSGYKWCYYVEGCMRSGSDPVDDAAVANTYGAEALSCWGPDGYPVPGEDAPCTTALSGVRVTWDFYNPGSVQAALDDILYRTGHETPTGVLVDIHHDADVVPAQGVEATQNGGPHAYWHCMTVLRYAADYKGLGPAVLVQNSYGPGYGHTGRIWLYGAGLDTIKGAFVLSTNPVPSWERALVAAVPLPRARPTPTPPLPAAIMTERPFYGVYVVRQSTNLRAAPRTDARVIRGLARATTLRSLGSITAHWARVTEHGAPGWAWRAFIIRSK